MDFGDIGQEATEIRTEALIRAKRAEARTTLEITGICHNPRCEDDCGNKAFCGPKCRDEYDKLKERMQ
jgi:hypothetical protein